MVLSSISGLNTRQGRLKIAAGIAAFAVSLSGCGVLSTKGSLTNPGSGVAPSLGCVQGTVIDGLTGKPVATAELTKKATSGIHVVVGDRVVAGTQMPGAEAAGTTAGGFSVCNIPLDENYPISVNLDGYQGLDGIIKIESTDAPKASHAVLDLVKALPVSIVNIRVYPLGSQTKDLLVQVTSDGVVYKGATVNLVPTGTSTLRSHVDGQGFLVPLNVHAMPLTGITDDNGMTVFKAETLVLGGVYDYSVIPRADEPTLATPARSTLTVGLLSEVAVQQPYFVTIDLKNSVGSLVAVSSSVKLWNLAGNADFNEEGVITIVFNRPVEIVPGTEDNIVASLTPNTEAVLASNERGNKKPDQVSVTIDPNDARRMTLSPIWKVKPLKDGDFGLKVKFSGISLRPKGSPGTADSLTVDDVTVPIFGGVTPVQIPFVRKLDLSGDSQSGQADADLLKDIQVSVVDQYGRAYRDSVYVQFEAKDGGTVRQLDASTGNVTANVLSVNGKAVVRWRLGRGTGTQTLIASLANSTSKVEFTAVASAYAKDIVILSGTGQTANANTELPTPIVVQVLDQNGLALRTSIPVRFTLSPSNGTTTDKSGSLRTVDNARIGTSISADSSTTDGKATVLWRLGNLGTATGDQTLSISLGSITKTLTARGLPVLTNVVSVGSSSGIIRGFNDPAILQVQLVDQADRPLLMAGKTVNFKVLSGDAKIKATDTGTEAPLLAAVSEADGRAKVIAMVKSGSVGSTVTVQAMVDGLPSMTFTISVKAVLSFVGKNIEEDLKPLKDQDVTIGVILQDQDRKVIVPASPLKATFTLVSGTGTLRLVATPTGTAGPVDVQTGNDGQASLIFKATGAVGSTFEIRAQIPGLNVVSFKGSIQ